MLDRAATKAGDDVLCKTHHRPRVFMLLYKVSTELTAIQHLRDVLPKNLCC